MSTFAGFPAEHFPNLLAEDAGREWFAQEIESRFVPAQLFGRVARHDEDADVRPLFEKLLDQRDAIHAGHFHVGDEHIDRPVILAGQFERFVTVRRRQDLVSLGLQEVSHEIANHHLVFGD